MFDKTEFAIGPAYLGECLWEFVDNNGNRYVVEGPDEDCAWQELEAGNTGKEYLIDE